MCDYLKKGMDRQLDVYPNCTQYPCSAATSESAEGMLVHCLGNRDSVPLSLLILCTKGCKKSLKGEGVSWEGKIYDSPSWWSVSG